MKTNLLLPFLIVMTVLSCKNDNTDSPTLIGQWRLSAQLIDPGDGSGTFQPISSNKQIEFYDNSTFVANGSMCQLNSDTGGIPTGTYSLTNKTLSENNCSNSLPIRFSLEGNDLIISYICKEACRQKYSKVVGE